MLVLYASIVLFVPPACSGFSLLFCYFETFGSELQGMKSAKKKRSILTTSTSSSSAVRSFHARYISNQIPICTKVCNVPHLFMGTCLFIPRRRGRCLRVHRPNDTLCPEHHGFSQPPNVSMSANLGHQRPPHVSLKRSTTASQVYLSLASLMRSCRSPSSSMLRGS
jgi:hypothetical protein